LKEFLKVNRTKLWTRRLGGLGLAAAAAAVLAGCASTPPEDPAVANLPRARLTGAELQSLVKERRFTTQRMSTTVLLDFREDGRVYAQAPIYRMRVLEGKWRFQGDDQFCADFPGLFASESGCYWIERRQDGTFFTVSVTNPSNAQRFVPGAIQAISP
jgi:hypothetical protein